MEIIALIAAIAALIVAVTNRLFPGGSKVTEVAETVVDAAQSLLDELPDAGHILWCKSGIEIQLNGQSAHFGATEDTMFGLLYENGVITVAQAKVEDGEIVSAEPKLGIKIDNVLAELSGKDVNETGVFTIAATEVLVAKADAEAEEAEEDTEPVQPELPFDEGVLEGEVVD